MGNIVDLATIAVTMSVTSVSAADYNWTFQTSAQAGDNFFPIEQDWAKRVEAMSIKKVAVFGLGSMGHGMAQSLIRSGFEVYGYDISPEPMARLYCLVRRLRLSLLLAWKNAVMS